MKEKVSYLLEKILNHLLYTALNYSWIKDLNVKYKTSDCHFITYMFLKITLYAKSRGKRTRCRGEMKSYKTRVNTHSKYDTSVLFEKKPWKVCLWACLSEASAVVTMKEWKELSEKWCDTVTSDREDVALDSAVNRGSL